MVRTLNRDGTTIVVVEQSVNVALTPAERAVFVHGEGHGALRGPTRELLERPDRLRSVFIGGAGGRQSPRTDRVLAAIDLTASTPQFP